MGAAARVGEAAVLVGRWAVVEDLLPTVATLDADRAAAVLE